METDRDRDKGRQTDREAETERRREKEEKKKKRIKAQTALFSRLSKVDQSNEKLLCGYCLFHSK